MTEEEIAIRRKKDLKSILKQYLPYLLCVCIFYGSFTVILAHSHALGAAGTATPFIRYMRTVMVFTFLPLGLILECGFRVKFGLNFPYLITGLAYYPIYFLPIFFYCRTRVKWYIVAQVAFSVWAGLLAVAIILSLAPGA